MVGNNIWLIYVGGNNRIFDNYKIGIDQGIWGLKEKNTNLERISLGDTVIFVQGMSWPKGELGKVPGWFPKFCGSIDDFNCNLKEVVEVEVTKPYFRSNTIVWTDSDYPHRFEFKVKSKRQNLALRAGNTPPNLSKAIMQSIIAGGTCEPLHDVGLDEAKLKQHENIDESYLEGKEYYGVHKRRERKSKASKDKKEQVYKATGDLKCEACDFSFVALYGERGKQFAECHHENPLADIDPTENTRTHLSDLAILCANCHRMIHRYKPWISVQTLRKLIKLTQQKSVKET
jgi:5-methylcytosine-specific restriction protein A